MLAMALPQGAAGQEAVLDILPLRPFNFDISFNQRTFAPEARVIVAQAGITEVVNKSVEIS